MRFVLKWSYACAKQLAISLNENHNKRAVYYYGFYILFGSLIKGIILISLSLILGILKPALLIVTVFGSLRLLAGGFHFDTFGRCLFISLGLIISSATLANYTYKYWNTLSVIIFLIITSIASVLILIKYAPKDTPTKPLTDPIKIMKLKKLSVIYFLLLLILCIFLTFYNMKMHVLAIIFGVLIEIFSVSPAGNSFFCKIKTAFNQI